jgi:CBS domain-containing protein
MRIIDTVGAVLSHKGSKVWTIPADATVYEAIQLMADKNIGALLVTDRGRLEGVFSERDYTRKVALQGRSSKETLVRAVLTDRVIAARPDDTIEACMRVMTDNRIRHLPVLDGDHVVGIVSMGDLVNWIISAQNVAITQLESYITGAYPG